MALMCTICNKLFSKHSNLRTHVKEIHAEYKVDDIAPNKKHAVAALCHECGKSFTTYQNLTKHVRIFHPDKEAKLTKPKAYTYECEECHKHFNNIKNFRRHKKNHENVESRKQYKCILCSTTVNLTKSEIWSHFQIIHDIVLSSDTLKFSNQDEFHIWKGEMERETQSFFINEHGSYQTNGYTKLKYVCHRSGIFISKSKGIRHLKVQGSHKMNGYCPAEISAKILNDGICEVEFVSKHIGHTDNLGYLNLNKTTRKDLAAKISSKIPFDTILDEVRDSISGDQLSRSHLLTKKDLSNIQQCFNLNKESVRHEKDAISVEAWIREVELTGSVLFYKPQDKQSEEHDLKNEDFVLIIMNRGQTEMIEKYGNYCICIDGTHGMNAYGFELITLLVLDDICEGFPSAFCISNRTDEVIMNLFFSCIKEKLGKNVCAEVFMSDMAQSFYNAWVQVMGPVKFRLFCSWHVDRAWRKNLNTVKSKEKQAEVYKHLRILIQERDINAFHPMCHNFITSLLADTHTLDFGLYFQEYYSKNVQEWAYCYHLHCGINTNMHIERMHRTLKYIYLNGKVGKRLDKCIHVLMKFVRDQLFERIIVINKGKILTKIKNLHARHKASLCLEERFILQTTAGWQVQSSSSNEVYTIEERQSNCKCKLVCSDCRACLHRYTCTCLDSSIKWNMCKHIHLVCRSLNKQPVPIKQESDNEAPDVIDEDTNYEEQKLTDTLIQDKKEEDMGSLDNKKEKLRSELNSIINSIKSNEQLKAFKKLTDPACSTIAAIEKQHEACSLFKRKPNSQNLSHNKNIPQQRRLCKTKKSTTKRCRPFAKPDSEEANNIALNLLYPSESDC